MPDNVLDLDIVRPKPRWVILDGKRIDISIVPCGITFEIDELSEKLSNLKEDEVAAGGAKAKVAFELGITLVSLFCDIQYPGHFTVDWFKAHTDPIQVHMLTQEIQAALTRSYEGVEQYQKKTAERTADK